MTLSHFKALRDYLQQAVPELRTIDLWNGQTDMMGNVSEERLEDSDALLLPAVYLQFDRLEAKQLGKDGHHLQGALVVHLAQDMPTGSKAFSSANDELLTVHQKRAKAQQQVIDSLDKAEALENSVVKALCRYSSDTPSTSSLQLMGLENDTLYAGIYLVRFSFNCTLFSPAAAEEKRYVTLKQEVSHDA